VTVLCIDDREDGLAIRRVFLETFGYKVITASSGQQGLDYAARTEPDVVLLDYQMPGMDGLEVAKVLRRDYPAVPIVLLTGFDKEVPGELSGIVNETVAKGNRPNELLEALARVVGRTAKRPLPRKGAQEPKSHRPRKQT